MKSRSKRRIAYGYLRTAAAWTWLAWVLIEVAAYFVNPGEEKKWYETF